MQSESNETPKETGSAHSKLSSGDSPPLPLPDTAVTNLRRLGHPAAEADEESPTTSRLTTNDPYNIGRGLKTDAEIAELRKRKGGKRLANYHQNQNDLIAYLLKPMEEHTEDARNEEDQLRLPVKFAVHASLVANITLAALQLYAAISSGSLSLLATSIDAIFDVGSNGLLYYINRKSSRMDVNKWPVGGARLETIGNVVYGSLMGSVNLVVIVESVRDLVNHGKALSLHIPSIVAVAVALCRIASAHLSASSVLINQLEGIEVLWEDHRNDLFINSFGLLMSAGGSKLAWYLDPLGGLLIAVGVIAAWSRTVYAQFELLAGKSAPHDFLRLIIYKAMTFSQEIEKIDTVRAYHSGPDYFVEVDVVMDANTPLWKAHDISQQLQDKIEVLPNVDRAFVHVDHETTHVPYNNPDETRLTALLRDTKLC